MITNNFRRINNTYFVKEGISGELLDKCFDFIVNQNNYNKNDIEFAFRKNNLNLIKFSDIFYNEVDIIIKTKLNNDFKFINISKSLIFSKYNLLDDKFIDKINKYKLDDIKFFPKTYISKNTIFQELARGNIFLPNRLIDLKKNLLSKIAIVINDLSSRNIQSIYVSDLLSKFKLSQIDDPINFKILNKFVLALNKYNKEKIKIALTHGDLKFEHLFFHNNQLEFVIDWENVNKRSIFFDTINFFTPWFVKREYNYLEIKNFIIKFIEEYLPNLRDDIKNKFNIYFLIFALERYMRMYESRSVEFDLGEAFKRYHALFKNLSKELH
tara:strand:+ start:1798 stop:2775 length:978 start_codon:yes stop_codon:yes gene_type:complete